MSDILVEVRTGMGLITLNRPKALNALSLSMIRELTSTLLAWRDDPAVQAVAIRGQGREAPFGAFCAGGDIRFFHQAALVGDPQLEDFFTEEYSLNYLFHQYPKPYTAFLDGIVMGGGMGISQAANLRVVTERTKMAMPETNIGLFPDVGGGYFLSRCPGRLGEYLALTGHMISGADAVAAGLADVFVMSGELPGWWERLASQGVSAAPARQAQAGQSQLELAQGQIDAVFGLDSVAQIIAALESDSSPWAVETAAVLRQRSPLMLHVALEQVRRGRGMNLADDLRMERGLMRHCFQLRPGAASETVEGIRALAIDKDQAPSWNPARIEEVPRELVEAFFESPWPAHAHPLRDLR